MARHPGDRDGRLAAIGARHGPLEELLDKLEAPPPSAALVGRIYRTRATGGGRQSAWKRLMIGSPAISFRRWAVSAATAVAVVLAVYVTSGEPDAVPAADTTSAASSLVPQFGTLHPAEVTLADSDDSTDDDDSDTMEASVEVDISMI